MKVPYSWLSEFIEIDGISPEAIVDRLSICSVEATLTKFDANIDGVVFGKVVQVKKLQKGLCCRVQVGEHTFISVYTADKNVKEGDGVFVALPNAKVNGVYITKRSFEDCVSEGMLLSAKELNLENHSEGVIKIEEDIPIGTDVYTLLGFGEPIIEVEVTPNRGDLLSVRGLAREIAALFKLNKKALKEECFEDFGYLDIKIFDEDCYRYSGCLIENVKIKESPLWLRKKLWQVGAKPINNVVDITNYILFRDGQPLHAFDLDKISGGIRVRKAQTGEKIVTLMGTEIELSPENLLIADDEKPLAIAGVIGGLDSSVTLNTKNVLLEAAYFDPYRIRKSSKLVSISTESSYRFERNIDIENLKKYQSNAVKLILELCSGTLVAVKDVYAKPYTPKEVFLSFEKLEKYSGKSIKTDKVVDTLERLEIPSQINQKGILATIPSHRAFDMSLDVDLIEEILRLEDYNTLEEEALQVRARYIDFGNLEQKVRNYLVSNGLTETISFSFEDEELYKTLKLPLPMLYLLNPLSKSQSLMRSSLIPSLIRTCIHNINQGIKSTAIFEIGKVYTPEGEKQKVGILLTGYKRLYPEKTYDAYDLLSYVQGIQFILGKSFITTSNLPNFIHPYVGVSFDGGYAGQLHPEISKELKLGKVYVAEIDIHGRDSTTQTTYKFISKYPPVIRDLSLVVEKNLPLDKLIYYINNRINEVLENMKVFSIYTDPERLGEGKKSVSIRLVFRSKDKSLSDEEVNRLVEDLLIYLEEKVEAKLR